MHFEQHFQMVVHAADNFCEHIAVHLSSLRIIACHRARFRRKEMAIFGAAMETRSRRSRTHRTRGTKRIAITPRDIEIFKLLGAYRYLRSTYLFTFLGGASETRFKERLGNLFHEGYLGRPEKQWEFANALCRPAVYELGDRGRHVLAECGEDPSPGRTFPAGSGQKQFRHALAICDVLASVEIGTRSKNVRFIPWGEILTRAPERTRQSPTPARIPILGGGEVSPDAIFGLEYLGQKNPLYRFCALEVDLATMPVNRTNGSQYSYVRKLDAYASILRTQAHKTILGVSTLFVLTVTTNPPHLATMMAGLRGDDVAGSFLFQAVDLSVSSRTLLHAAPVFFDSPWQRAMHPSLTLNSPR